VTRTRILIVDDEQENDGCGWMECARSWCVRSEEEVKFE
jgi:hypothetical protein